MWRGFFLRDAVLSNLSKIQEHRMWHVTVLLKRCKLPNLSKIQKHYMWHVTVLLERCNAPEFK